MEAIMVDIEMKTLIDRIEKKIKNNYGDNHKQLVEINLNIENEDIPTALATYDEDTCAKLASFGYSKKKNQKQKISIYHSHVEISYPEIHKVVSYFFPKGSVDLFFERKENDSTEEDDRINNLLLKFDSSIANSTSKLADSDSANSFQELLKSRQNKDENKLDNIASIIGRLIEIETDDISNEKKIEYLRGKPYLLALTSTILEQEKEKFGGVAHKELKNGIDAELRHGIASGEYSFFKSLLDKDTNNELFPKSLLKIFNKKISSNLEEENPIPKNKISFNLAKEDNKISLNVDDDQLSIRINSDESSNDEHKHSGTGFLGLECEVLNSITVSGEEINGIDSKFYKHIFENGEKREEYRKDPDSAELNTEIRNSLCGENLFEVAEGDDSLDNNENTGVAANVVMVSANGKPTEYINRANKIIIKTSNMTSNCSFRQSLKNNIVVEFVFNDKGEVIGTSFLSKTAAIKERDEGMGTIKEKGYYDVSQEDVKEAFNGEILISSGGKYVAMTIEKMMELAGKHVDGEEKEEEREEDEPETPPVGKHTEKIKSKKSITANDLTIEIK
jgi:hypothetical protein